MVCFLSIEQKFGGKHFKIYFLNYDLSNKCLHENNED